jgi:hypothetical protein
MMARRGKRLESFPLKAVTQGVYTLLAGVLTANK